MARIDNLISTHHTLLHTARPKRQSPSSNVPYLSHQMKDCKTSHLERKIKPIVIVLHYINYYMYETTCINFQLYNIIHKDIMPLRDPLQ